MRDASQNIKMLCVRSRYTSHGAPPSENRNHRGNGRQKPASDKQQLASGKRLQT
jgi:hypothetical protein